MGIRLSVGAKWFRFIGIILLIVLLARIDIRPMLSVVRNVAPALLALAILLNIPQILLKVIRWRWLLQAQGVSYKMAPATLSYFGSIFIGLLTPGRLGEFVKALHVSHDCNLKLPRAFSSVLSDRLFDLYALFLFGASVLMLRHSNVMLLIVCAVVLTLPVIFLLQNNAFRALQNVAGKWSLRLFADDGWIAQLRSGLRELDLAAVVGGTLLTAAAYSLFFFQCDLLGIALGLKAGFIPISCAVALGSLVTLLPVSISGLGTREATIVAYLRSAGVPASAGLGFSLLVFATFYIAGGFMGAIAWYLKPVSWKTDQIS